MNLILAFLEASNRVAFGGHPSALLEPLRELAPNHEVFKEPLSLPLLYGAVGDAIRWGRSADSKIVKLTGESNWWQEFDYGYLIPGVRFVRNAVEHDWSRVITVPDEMSELRGQIDRREFDQIVWAKIDGRRPGWRDYEQHFAEQSLQLTMRELVAVFAKAILVMDDRDLLW